MERPTDSHPQAITETPDLPPAKPEVDRCVSPSAEGGGFEPTVGREPHSSSQDGLPGFGRIPLADSRYGTGNGAES
jgi:hypothetical protein